MNKRRFWILIICFHALFFGKQLFFQNSMLQDSREYLYAAENLIQHNTLYAWDLNDDYNKNWLSKRPFLYPCILAVFKLISPGSGKFFFFLIYLLQNLASLLSIKLVLKIAGKYSGRIHYTYAALFLLFSFSQVIYANMVMTEIWLQLCMVSVVYLLLMHPHDAKRLLYISMLLMAGMSLKPVLIFTAFCFPLYYLARSFSSLKLKHLLLTLLPLCFYFASCRINQQRTGYFHYSSISNINLLHYNTYSMLLNKYGLQKADSIVDQINLEARQAGDYAAQQDYIRKACAQQVGNHLALYAWLHARGGIYCLLDPGRFDFTQFFNLPHKQNLIYETNKEGAIKTVLKSFLNPLGILLGFLLLFNVFKVFVLVRFVFLKAISLWVRLCVLFFPVYILFFTGPIGTSRFYMPFIPMVLLAFLLVYPKWDKRPEKS
jgi:hypothetical protein